MILNKNVFEGIALFVLLLIYNVGESQSLPIDFESEVTTSNFIDFDGGTASVIANPAPMGINTSATVAQIVRDGGLIWSGSKIELDANLDFSSSNSISMKVYTSAPIGTIVKFKLEGSGVSERDIPTTVSNEWEVLTWDFTGKPSVSNTLVFMFDFGNLGDGSESSTFLFDDIEQAFGGSQIDLPVDFESSTVNYVTTDFGGNVSTLATDPSDPNNTVVQVVKTDQAASWAGTTIGTSGGFATDIPLTLTNSKMTVKVWSPEAGTPIRLKVEDSKDPTHTSETETNTTVSKDWETLEFDFTNEATGTQMLSVGLDMGWTFNMASIFFNFGTEGASAGEKTYYFDDVQMADLVLSTSDLLAENISIFPNPTSDNWTIKSETSLINLVELFDFKGRRLVVFYPENNVVKINAYNLEEGLYISRISTDLGTRDIKLIKK